MSNRRYALVVPNNRIIREEFCKSYYINILKYGHDPNNVKLIIVDDYSPYVNKNKKILENSGIPFDYWLVEDQIRFFKSNLGQSWEKYWSVIPHKTDACRSFGYIIAALWGADVIITLDDDNYAINEPELPDYDYIGNHDVIDSEVETLTVSSSSKWFNTLLLLQTTSEREIYARGYPYSRRYGEIHLERSRQKIVMNVGLWTNNPDVDSITVLSEGGMNGLPKTKVLGMKNDVKRVALSKGTYAPLNTANTAYSRNLLPVIYDTFQGVEINGLKLDRFGDIWCNLFVQKILEVVGNGGISIGLPLVEHKREPRDTFEDFKKEFWGIIWSEKLFKAIETIEISAKNYMDGYLMLIDQLEKTLVSNEPAIERYFSKLFASMRLWCRLLEKLNLC